MKIKNNLKTDNNPVTIREACREDIDELAPLFAAFRVFYKQDFELEKSSVFLKERFRLKDSVIFIAVINGEIGGFVQLFPTFTTIGLSPIWILNDLFVSPKFRNRQIAQKLIDKVLLYSKMSCRTKVRLSAAFDNHTAQRLYEKTGFTKTNFYNYEIEAK